jgi:hypothetical protein
LNKRRIELGVMSWADLLLALDVSLRERQGCNSPCASVRIPAKLNTAIGPW